MSESKTPRTDSWEFVAFVTDSTMRRHDCKVIHALRARELESDLAAAQARIAELEAERERLLLNATELVSILGELEADNLLADIQSSDYDRCAAEIAALSAKGKS